MSPFVYQLGFNGGPYDGLQMYTLDLPDTRLLLPAEYDASRSALVAYCRLEDASAAIYRFERMVVADCVSGVPPTLRYAFVGFTAPSRHLQSVPARTKKRWFRNWIAAKVKRLYRCFCDWSLTPVTYPFQIARPTVLHLRQIPRADSQASLKG